ncbi:unnamed protein product [Pieris macdunnoughi]|nr:unnamed protein product [Pieris macdunnoughi]
MSNSRAQKILQLSMQNEQHELDETNNPDSVLFVNNQFPKPYDTLVDSVASNSASSTYFDNGYIDCIENEQPGVQYTYTPQLLGNNISDNQSCFKTQTYYEIVENVVIEDMIPPETEQLSPSLLYPHLSPSLNYNPENASNSFEPTHAYPSTSNDNLIVPLTQEELTAHESIPQIPTACPELMNKLVDYSDSDSEPDEPVIKRKKRCQVKKEDWSSEVNKKNREKGKEYCGKKKVDGEWKKNIKKPKKVLKPRCSCKERGNSVIQCHSISEDDRKILFDKFWKLTWDEKRVYVDNLVKIVHTNRQRDRKDPQKSKRVNTFIYHLKKGEDMIRVCKTLFLNTLSIGKSCIWGWKIEVTGKNTDEKLPETPPRKPFDQEIKMLQEFLDELPKMPSHYCRKRTTQTYIQPDISSKQQLYKIYTDYCASKHKKALSIATFTNTLTIQKIALFKPKKDLCDICNGYKLGHVTKETYDDHVNKKNEARMEKESDKEKKEFVFSADLQAVLLAPRSNVSSNYYKTKLCVHNWCIYDMKTSDGYCFLWNEVEGGLNSDEFATILSNFFTDKVIPKMGDDNRYITLYTDGCTYQNRNVILSNALLNIAMLHNVTIEQKYLEVGHTQMEVDSMHAMIEKKLKNQVINVPAEYITICKNAKKSKPYIVEYLNYSYFRNFKNLQFYNSIRPGKMKGDPKVTDIRALKYTPSREIFYKLKLTEDYKLLNQRRNARINNIPFHNLPDLYNERRKITKKKYLDLQQLKNSMPRDYQNYYDNLPHEA